MMKKVLFATISACAVFAAAAAPSVASAAADTPEYPDIYDAPLAFEALSDYAVGDSGVYAFADGGKVLLLNGEDLTTYSFDGEAEFVDCVAADGGEKFYYTLKGSADAYVLPNSPGEPAQRAADVTMQGSIEGQYPFNGFTYSLVDGTLSIWDGTSGSPASFEGYSRLKHYGKSLYAVNGNSVYELDGNTPKELEFKYSNYSMLTKIPVGDAKEKLNTYSTFGQNCKVVTITEGATATKIDLNELASSDSGFFPVTDPRASTQKLSSGQALLVCETGSLRIVAKTETVNGEERQVCYILNAADAPDLAKLAFTPLSGGATATVNADEYAHSLPLMSNATRVFRTAPNERVEVLGSVAAEGVLTHSYYLIKNSDGKFGYVAFEFINNLNYPAFDEGGASNISDPSPSYEDSVRTVVLVLVVVALVLIAAGYITWVATSKRKKVKKNADGEVDITKEQRAEDEDRE